MIELQNVMKFIMGLGIAIVSLAFAIGCSSTSSEFSTTHTAYSGNYPPPAPGFQKHKLAVIYFQDKTGGGEKRAMAAADQMTTLLFKTYRFQMVERERMKDLLKEQKMHGIVAPDEMARAGQILGVELLCYGSITDFEIKHTKTESGGGILRNVGGHFVPGLSVLDIDFKKAQLDFHIGVDVRIVDPTSGEIIFAENADVKRNETASGMGLNIAGISTSSGASIEVDSENQGRLLRMALDEVVKRLLPQIDQKYGN